MWSMVQQDKPEDFVIATGQTRSVRQFVEAALEFADLPVDIDRYVQYDEDMHRPSEVDLLVGDATKAKVKLGWTPKTSFEGLVALMMENDLRTEGRN
jgi:GDPmannose 4,6-dehydratase